MPTLQERLERTEREIAKCSALAADERLSIEDRWGAMIGVCDWEIAKMMILEEIAKF